MTKYRILQNTTALTLSGAFEKAILYVFFAMIARKTGPLTLGAFFTAFTFVTICFIWNELGLTALISREVSKKKKSASEYLNNALGIRIVTVGITLIALYVYTFCANDPKDITTGIVLLSVYFAFSYLAHPFVGVFKAFERMEYVSYTIIIDRIIIAGGGILLLSINFDIAHIEVLFIIGGLARFISSYYFVKKFDIPIKISLNVPFCKKMLSSSIPIGVYMILYLLYHRADTMILYFFNTGIEAIGWYNAAHMIFMVALLPAISFAHSIYPRLAQKNMDLDQSINKKLNRVCFYIFLIYAMVGIGLVLVADILIDLIYGIRYKESANLLKVLSIGIVFDAICTLFQWIFISIGRTGSALYVVMTMAIVNIVFNVVLIPLFGHAGAAYTIVITTIIGAIISLRLYDRHFQSLRSALIHC